MRQDLVSLSGRHGYYATLHRFPPLRHFERVADEEDFEALDVIEALTDDCIRDEIGLIEIAPAHERLYGTHVKPVMAAFAHWDADGGAFSDGSHGVFCFALDEDTAMAQAMHRLATFLAATEEKPACVRGSLYSFRLSAELIDLRTTEAEHQEYATSESGKRLSATGVSGVLFPSPLNEGGECVAAFKTTGIADCLHAAHLEFNWNGKRIEAVTQRAAT